MPAASSSISRRSLRRRTIFVSSHAGPRAGRGLRLRRTSGCVCDATTSPALGDLHARSDRRAELVRDQPRQGAASIPAGQADRRCRQLRVRLGGRPRERIVRSRCHDNFRGSVGISESLNPHFSYVDAAEARPSRVATRRRHGPQPDSGGQVRALALRRGASAIGPSGRAARAGAPTYAARAADRPADNPPDRDGNDEITARRRPCVSTSAVIRRPARSLEFRAPPVPTRSSRQGDAPARSALTFDDGPSRLCASHRRILRSAMETSVLRSSSASLPTI